MFLVIRREVCNDTKEFFITKSSRDLRAMSFAKKNSCEILLRMIRVNEGLNKNMKYVNIDIHRQPMCHFFNKRFLR